jgi:hypothetical protein
MRNFSLSTLKKQLENAQRKRDGEIMRPTGMSWGYGMRHCKLPSDTKLMRLDNRIKDLKERIAQKESEVKNA